MDLNKIIRDVNDFPKEGIVFKDITTLLKNKEAFNQTLEELYNFSKNQGITKVVGIEARGFIFGGALANKLNAGFVPIRKPGKLPSEVYEEEYELEYGIDKIEIHKDAIDKDDIVLLHDDLLATGGTMKAACNLIEKMGARIAQISFIIELDFLKGRELLKPYKIHSLLNYDD
ncbi:MAG: adenine phosphoribosyltransferase [Ignavibacteriae bacterium]|nr:MAG: adenine phosphoribosyltransferase [Ignavibacteriota bacterium]